MYYEFPLKYYGLLTKGNNFVLLETSSFDRENHRTFLFLNPIRILKANSVTDTSKLFKEIQHNIHLGYYVAGYLGYECCSSFENIKQWKNTQEDYPLAWFGVYNKPLIFN